LTVSSVSGSDSGGVRGSFLVFGLCRLLGLRRPVVDRHDLGGVGIDVIAGDIAFAWLAVELLRAFRQGGMAAIVDGKDDGFFGKIAFQPFLLGAEEGIHIRCVAAVFVAGREQVFVPDDAVFGRQIVIELGQGRGDAPAFQGAGDLVPGCRFIFARLVLFPDLRLFFG
jgi:hypothetical protein